MLRRPRSRTPEEGNVGLSFPSSAATRKRASSSIHESEPKRPLIRRPRSMTPEEEDEGPPSETSDVEVCEGQSNKGGEKDSGSEGSKTEGQDDPVIYITWLDALSDTILHNTGEQAHLLLKSDLLQGHKLLLKHEERCNEDPDYEPEDHWSHDLDVDRIRVETGTELVITDDVKAMARIFDEARKAAVTESNGNGGGKVGKNQVEEPNWWEVTVWRNEPHDQARLAIDTTTKWGPSCRYWITDLRVADEEGAAAIEALSLYLMER